MRTDLPNSQWEDAFELESKGLRDFFKIQLNDGNNTSLHLTPHNSCIFLGVTWEAVPCNVADISQQSSGEQNRPKFTVVNPQGLFSSFVQQGKLDGALVTRYRTLLTDLESDNRAYSKSMWRVSRIISLTKDLLVLELRSSLDAPLYHLPARSFYPPEFPHVSLR